MITVTKSFLPPLEDYLQYLQHIWNSEKITNRGPLVLELEEKLKVYLEVDHMLIMNNGTIPIQIALQLLANRGEVITTPFSYVATTAAIVWENCTPVFVDIHPTRLTIDEKKIESAITDKTTCILATHVFGNPCNVEMIDDIAKKHNIKVIYDAAHCFGVQYKGKSIFSYGDVSTCSFHATKLFHTGEGGAIFCNDPELRHQIYYSHNFGHNGPEDFYGLGVNAKISELQAAMGLAVFSHMSEILAARDRVIVQYQKLLLDSGLLQMELLSNTSWNNSYFPVVFKSERQLLQVMHALNEEQIFPRRYFYPSLNKLNYVAPQLMPVSEDIASRILCLPLAHDLMDAQVERICAIILSNLNKDGA